MFEVVKNKSWTLKLLIFLHANSCHTESDAWMSRKNQKFENLQNQLHVESFFLADSVL